MLYAGEFRRGGRVRRSIAIEVRKCRMNRTMKGVEEESRAIPGVVRLRGPGGSVPDRAGSMPAKRRGPPGPARKGASARPGSLRLAPIGGNRFELVHPACVRETELDYEEGLEIWKAGDPEGARDALRYALAACRDNMWIHVALGRIALEEFRDPTLARGHFGYAVELGRRALPPQFAGRLPRRPAGQPAVPRRPGGVDPLARGPGPARRFGRPAHAQGTAVGGESDGQSAASGRPDPGVVKKAVGAGRSFSTLRIFRTCREPPIGIEPPQTEAHKQEGMARHSCPLRSCRRKGSRTSMSRGIATGGAVVFSSRSAVATGCPPRPSRLGAWVR